MCVEACCEGMTDCKFFRGGMEDACSFLNTIHNRESRNIDSLCANSETHMQHVRKNSRKNDFCVALQLINVQNNKAPFRSLTVNVPSNI